MFIFRRPWETDQCGVAAVGCDDLPVVALGLSHSKGDRPLLHGSQSAYNEIYGKPECRTKTSKSLPIQRCPNSASTLRNGSLSTCTGPVKGWLIDMITKRLMKTRIERIPVIRICARRFLVPKKNLNPTVRTPPSVRTAHSIDGTIPTARCSRLLRACVRASS